MSNQSSGDNRATFLRSEKATELRQALTDMNKDPRYNTRVATLLAENDSYFVEKHMAYMSNHLKMDHSQYVQNLRLMTKIQSKMS